jgi:hypothetical protein
MKKLTRTVFQTSDGEVFEDYDKAYKHEVVPKLVELMNSSRAPGCAELSVVGLGSSTAVQIRVAEWIADNWTYVDDAITEAINGAK